jgi:hypothetical protein
VSEDRFDDLFGLYIDLRLRRAMERKIAPLESPRRFGGREDEEVFDGEEIDEEPPRAEIPAPRQLAPPPPQAPPAEGPHQKTERRPGQQNGYSPPPPRGAGRPRKPRPELPGGPPGQHDNQEEY